MAVRFGSDVLPDERRPVAWYSPPVLLQAARELLSSQDFQRNLDRRDNFAGELAVVDLSQAEGDFGFDFLADTGDGGNATYTVASAATADTLTLADGSRHARPPLVVLGGDLAYPTASSLDYHYRFLELFSLAAPGGAEGRPRAWERVLAIPQNHDWFDSVTTFSRYFVGRAGKRDFVNADAPQTRTYFAARLPHGWWILGLDFALRGDIDRNQFEAFCRLWDRRGAGPHIAPGDNVIVVYPEPYWTKPLSADTPEGYTRRYQRLEHLLEAPPADPADAESHGAGARLRLRLCGDLHHYACRSAEVKGDSDAVPWRTALVTCGSAGAFLHTTHGREVQGDVLLCRRPAEHTVPPTLGQRVRVGLRDGSEDAARATRFGPPKVYPGAWRSRWFALSRLPLSLLRPRLRRPRSVGALAGQLWNSNLGFVLLLGLLFVANANVNALLVERYWPGGPPDAWVEHAQRWLFAMFSSPLATLFNLGMVTGCVRLGWEGTWPRWAKLLAGVLHGMAQGFIVFAAYRWATQWVQQPAFEAWLPLAQSALKWTAVGTVGGLCGALLFGTVFALLNVLGGQLTNNASGAMAGEDHKGFLRFSLQASGLTMHMFGCDRVPRRWRAGADGVPQAEGPAPRWHLVDTLELPAGRD
ncbi:MAG: hypothetical protein JNM33_05110 [Rubrivivax sp.]|nr:hypothetical protein [Rubrivivax sp.]